MLIIGINYLDRKKYLNLISFIELNRNPIDFNNRLYFYYAFVYLFITILTIVPLGFFCFSEENFFKEAEPENYLLLLLSSSCFRFHILLGIIKIYCSIVALLFVLRFKKFFLVGGTYQLPSFLKRVTFECIRKRTML
ncbi:hypothetical protein A7975_10595 [Bacillus sp. FJAT-26390]|nr:hypothetical protein A7975_10595 [Bacillus sp. FJAT-26390]